MKQNLLPVFTAFLIFASCMPGTAAGLDGIISGLQKKYETINTVSADFTQEVSSKSIQGPRASAGKVYFKKPGKMKWLYDKPNKDVLVSDGKTIRLYQPDLNQVMERQADTKSSSIATDFLSGVGDLKKDFEIKLAEETRKSYLLSLTPKAQQPNVRELFLEIDRPDFIVTKTIVEDYFGNRTAVTFKNIKTNADIMDSFFEFPLPRGATVVRP